MDWEHAFGQQISDAPGPEPGRHVDHQAYGWFRIFSMQRSSSTPS